jgi:hypothetical protein
MVTQRVSELTPEEIACQRALNKEYQKKKNARDAADPQRVKDAALKKLRRDAERFPALKPTFHRLRKCDVTVDMWNAMREELGLEPQVILDDAEALRVKLRDAVVRKHSLGVAVPTPAEAE